MMTCRKSTAFLMDVTRLSPPPVFEERASEQGYLAVRKIKLCMYENLTYIPHAAHGYLLDYSDKNIRNDVRQIIILYEKSQFNSPVWGSFTLAPINAKHYTVHRYIGATYTVK